MATYGVGRHTACSGIFSTFLDVPSHLLYVGFSTFVPLLSSILAVSTLSSKVIHIHMMSTQMNLYAFFHGLDSSTHTWRCVQQSLTTPSIAIDCRG
jgi:hypothetical protein